MNNIFCRSGCAHAYLKIGVAILLAALNSACDKNGFTYDLTDGNQPSNYILTDTLTIDMQTVQLDSIPTSGDGIIVCGRHQDPYFGKITASSFFQLQLPQGTLTDVQNESSRYDSIELVLKPNRQVYGDTTSAQDFGVYEVLETIQPANNGFALYNNSNFLTGSQSLGNFQQPRNFPNIDTTVRVKLENSFGNTLFQLFKNKAPEVSTQANFLQYYRGLALKPGANSANIMGFFTGDTSVMLRVHYHINEPIISDRHLDMPMYNPNLQFNQVSADRTGTVLAALNGSTKSLPSTQTNNQGFVQYLSRIVTRIDMPGLKGLASLGKFFKVMRATLILQPVAGTYETPYALPPRVTICETDQKNNVVDTVTSPTAGIQYGNLVIDKQYYLNTNYTYDITHYVINNIASVAANNYGLMITPTRGDALTNFNRLVLGDTKQKYRAKVQVYYLLYQNQ
ncbi:DUF4270 domain-containing protein [Chitinophaga agrisoli]|uniref:DUF4270 domain-containing protein n=1 Tax=Chitinophaga agrisoli TaxID=2607653 RepID=A0A5B2VSG5_9BACT|nr:DUF4270 family protein [Chitinophaga agrisoli]KAA2241784.1 DUF4270 domain-containing protein [Chitinophaga agrisoli]